MTYEIRAKGTCTPGNPTSDRPVRDTRQAPLGGREGGGGKVGRAWRRVALCQGVVSFVDR